jgi:hypothetical protein
MTSSEVAWRRNIPVCLQDPEDENRCKKAKKNFSLLGFASLRGR